MSSIGQNRKSVELWIKEPSKTSDVLKARWVISGYNCRLSTEKKNGSKERTPWSKAGDSNKNTQDKNGKLLATQQKLPQWSQLSDMFTNNFWLQELHSGGSTQDIYYVRPLLFLLTTQPQRCRNWCRARITCGLRSRYECVWFHNWELRHRAERFLQRNL